MRFLGGGPAGGVPTSAAVETSGKIDYKPMNVDFKNTQLPVLKMTFSESGAAQTRSLMCGWRRGRSPWPDARAGGSSAWCDGGVSKGFQSRRASGGFRSASLRSDRPNAVVVSLVKVLQKSRGAGPVNALRKVG